MVLFMMLPGIGSPAQRCEQAKFNEAFQHHPRQPPLLAGRRLAHSG